VKNIFLMSCLFIITVPSYLCAAEGEYVREFSNDENLTEQEQLLSLAEETKEIMQDARWAMIEATSRFLKKQISAQECEDILYEHSGIMASVQKDLKQSLHSIIAESGNEQVQGNMPQEGYMTRIKRSLMAWYGYEVTPEQKKSRQELDILIQQKEIIQHDYELVVLEEITADQKEMLKARYANVIAKIDNEIYQKQVAIGSRWSLLKKAIVAGMVTSAATVAGLLFTNNWWGTVENK